MFSMGRSFNRGEYILIVVAHCDRWRAAKGEINYSLGPCQRTRIRVPNRAKPLSRFITANIWNFNELHLL
jgi:hypothetical protein